MTFEPARLAIRFCALRLSLSLAGHVGPLRDLPALLRLTRWPPALTLTAGAAVLSGPMGSATSRQRMWVKLRGAILSKAKYVSD